MRFFLPFAAGLLAYPAWADDAPKPNTLTPKEVAEGWILLFDGETTVGWKTEGTVQARGGSLLLGGDRESSMQTTCSFGSDFEVSFEYRHNNEEGGVSVGLTERGAPWAWAKFSLSPTESKWGQGTIALKYDRVKKTLATKISSRGKTTGASSQDSESPVERPNQGIGFISIKGYTLELRNIRLKPVGLQPIFNGKDLTGWHEFPGRKSKFSVTPEGWLNIKNGNGDLQTEGQWADFVLQIECRCNGDHLNSGVFFRCRPGEYQQGYEAQIHNHFTKEPMKEYTLEEYDPTTNELREKKKAKFAAVDYGTGAIYRRQPARREVAKDREWFTMTVAAQGRHMATWVNGIQVTDWTDNRPKKDNARNGCYLEKGPISLQGHDPTTDISFRNIRIAELPPAKP
jgi:hypothetical protein